MYIIVIGGGTVGYGLALELSAVADHEVLLVERERARALQLREESGELVVQGDGTEVTFMESLGARRADLVIAVTGDDGANLVACQVAQHWFGVTRTIARVNDPRNERLFLRLGIESTVSAAAAVLAQIEVALPEHTVIPLLRLRESGLEVVDLHVQEGSTAAGRTLRSLPLPPQTVISVIIGANGPRIPDGDTVLQAGDEVIAVIRQEAQESLHALMGAIALDLHREG